MRRKLMIFAIAGMLLGLAGASVAQVITGTISGTVKDSSGAVVPGATVTVTNTDKNIVVRTVKADAVGAYTAPLLRPVDLQRRRRTMSPWTLMKV